jgi:hypothetical protein
MMRRIAFPFVLIGLAGSLGCNSEPVMAPGITAAQLCARQAYLIAEQSPYPTLNEIFDTMAQTLPGGFAGMAVGEWYLQDTTLADTARATAAVLSACPGAQAQNIWEVVQTKPVRPVPDAALAISIGKLFGQAAPSSP